MGSYDYGKTEIVEWVKENFPKGSTCLDVGACDGKWARLLGDYLTMDAVEIFPPSGARLNGYRRVLIQDIADYTYEHYDLILFGDVIEHMTVEKAQRVLEYAYPRCKDMIIGVPFLYHQDELYGNPWEKHIQEDLTEERFAERYPQYKLLLKAANDYAYYTKDNE